MDKHSSLTARKISDNENMSLIVFDPWSQYYKSVFFVTDKGAYYLERLSRRIISSLYNILEGYQTLYE